MRPLWARLVSTDYVSQKPRRRIYKSKGNRLRMEQLENRLFMNADNPLAVSPLQSGQDALQATAVASSSVNDTTNAPWQRFQSTEELEAWVVEAAVARWQHLFGQTSAIIYCGDANIGGSFALAMPSEGSVTISTTNLISNTNLQVAGVDEADLVETDGEFLYIISGSDLLRWLIIGPMVVSLTITNLACHGRPGQLN